MHACRAGVRRVDVCPRPQATALERGTRRVLLHRRAHRPRLVSPTARPAPPAPPRAAAVCGLCAVAVAAIAAAAAVATGP
eukprot:360311-Chlamydomonas_euryale.AAC.2